MILLPTYSIPGNQQPPNSSNLYRPHPQDILLHILYPFLARAHITSMINDIYQGWFRVSNIYHVKRRQRESNGYLTCDLTLINGIIQVILMFQRLMKSRNDHTNVLDRNQVCIKYTYEKDQPTASGLTDGVKLPQMRLIIVIADAFWWKVRTDAVLAVPAKLN